MEESSRDLRGYLRRIARKVPLALAGLGSVTAARGRSGRVAVFALGLAAGSLFGLIGGVLKATVHAAARNPAAAAGWLVWTLAALGARALAMHQRAYAQAPLDVSLPVLSVANSLAGIALGVLVFGENPASGALALSGEALGLAVIVASVTILARTAARTGIRLLSPVHGGQQSWPVLPAQTGPAGDTPAGGAPALPVGLAPPGRCGGRADGGGTLARARRASGGSPPRCNP